MVSSVRPGAALRTALCHVPSSFLKLSVIFDGVLRVWCGQITSEAYGIYVIFRDVSDISLPYGRVFTLDVAFGTFLWINLRDVT